MAAKQGHPSAEFNAGVAYEQGKVVFLDLEKALYWYKRSSEHGLIEGSYHLGRIYFEGIGVPEDCCEALKWFLLAAEGEHAEAQYLAGWIL